MPDTPPDRLSNNPQSEFYDADILARDVGIRFNGVEKNNVEEYCVSEGWVRVAAGNAKDRHGNPLDNETERKSRALFPREKGLDPRCSERPPAEIRKSHLQNLHW